jgi:hypothetical protein
MSNNRRLRKRVNLSVYLSALNAADGTELGHLLDISAAGFLVLTDRELLPQEDMSVNITLPEPIETRTTINVLAKFIRCKDSKRKKFYEAAFEIIYASSDTKRIIETIQQRWELKLP